MNNPDAVWLLSDKDLQLIDRILSESAQVRQGFEEACRDLDEYFERSVNETLEAVGRGIFAT